MKVKYKTHAVVTECKDAGMKPMPPDRWEATFRVRAARITFRSYFVNRDEALIEMLTLTHQYLAEPWVPKLESMKRL